jgi:hypothetical protein
LGAHGRTAAGRPRSMPSDIDFTRAAYVRFPVWRARRRNRRLLCVWGPKPSGTRRRTASHRVFLKMRPRSGVFRTSASTIPCFGALAVESGTYFARGGPSRAGLGGCIALRIRENAPSKRRFSHQRVDYSLFRRARRRKRRVLGARGPKPSGTRRGPASHCVFVKMRPRRGDFRRVERGDFRRVEYSLFFGALTVESGAYSARGDSNRTGVAADCLELRIRENAPSTWRSSTLRMFPVLARSPSKAARSWRVGTQAERGTAADRLALRIRENAAPSTRRF